MTFDDIKLDKFDHRFDHVFTCLIQNASSQKMEMETLQKQAAEENQKLELRKKDIDVELAEIEPLVKVEHRGTFKGYVTLFP